MIWEEIQKPFARSPNCFLRADGFHVSFKQVPGTDLVGSLFDSDDGGPETTLCKGGEYYVLNGDFRESYERLVPLGFDECKRFYDQQAAHCRSSWSTDRLEDE